MGGRTMQAAVILLRPHGGRCAVLSWISCRPLFACQLPFASYEQHPLLSVSHTMNGDIWTTFNPRGPPDANRTMLIDAWPSPLTGAAVCRPAVVRDWLLKGERHA
jgi:hypothetical protein